MRVLSAVDAIAPAIDRTRRYLFRPFKCETFLKLAAVAAISEGASFNMNVSMPGSNHLDKGLHATAGPWEWTPGWIAFGVIAGLLMIAVSVVVCYLVIRLRFTFFDMLATLSKAVRPAWRLYPGQAMRMFKLSLVIGAGCLLLAFVLAVPVVLMFRRLMATGQASAGFLVPIVLLVPVVAAGFLLLVALDIVLHDFMLPHMALDNLSVGDAWRAVRAHMAIEKGAFVLYFVLRLLLPVIAFIGAFIVAAIPMLIVFGILAASAAGFSALLQDVTGAGEVVRVALEAIFGAITVGVGLLVAFSLGGPIGTWIRNFALIFYGGRYPRLGEVLWPAPPPPPAEQGE